MGRFENFTPPTLGSELSTSEITMLEELTALANSGTGEFIRKSAGSLVNATLSETVALSGLSDVAISSPASGHVLSYNGSSWVNSSLSETISLSELDDVAFSGLAINHIIKWNGSSWFNEDQATGVGTVTTVSVVTANGVSGTVATATTTPAITLTLGAITPSTVNGLTITANGTNTLSIAAGKTLTVSNTLTLTATDGSTLAIGAGGTLGSAAYTASTAYAAALGADDNYVTDAEKTALHASGSDDTFTVANEATDTTCFPLFVTAATGDLGPKTVATLTFNSNTGSLGATTFVGALTGNASGSAATVTGAAQVAITSLGTLTTLTVDDITINGNLISSAGASSLAITPTAGQAILFDATISLDAGVITGATSITSTDFVGALTGTATGNLVSGGALGTPSSGTGTNITGIPAANILAGSFGAGAYVISTSLQAATIELGHATDTTLSRVSAGVVAIEGVNILTTAGGTLTGNITLGEGADPATTGIVMDNSMSADERYSGITVPGTAGATLAFGDICYLDVTATEWLLADASAASTAGDVVLGICVDASTDGAATSMLLMGTVRSAAFPASIALGAPVYVSETAGDITATQPVTTDAVIRVCGWAVTVEPNTIYFNPSSDYITHT